MTGSRTKSYSKESLDMLRNVRGLDMVCELCNRDIKPEQKVLFRYINGKSHLRHVECHSKKVL